jgi:glycosyltransferase involved in cell wall biosynthesis
VKVTAMLPSRLYLSDPLLKGVAGHHLGYNLALADAARRAGVITDLVTHRDFDPGLADGYPTHRIFQTDHRFEPPSWMAGNQQLLTWLAAWSAFRFGRNLKHFPAVQSSEAVFAQMLAPRHFLEWLKWFHALVNPPVLFLHLGYSPEKFSDPKVANAFQALSKRRRERILLITDSEKLVPSFERIFGDKVHHLPHVISYDIPDPELRPRQKPLVIFAPGNARREKGFAEFCRAAETISASGVADDFRFVIQCHDPDPVCATTLKEGIAKDSGIEWISRPLPDQEYTERLAQADVLLLPYHLDQYARRTSGIFCEARVAGKPVITTRGSWAGDRVLREGGGWLVDERNAASLTDALLDLPSGFDRQASEALALSGKAKTEFHRDSFMAGMLDLFSRAVSA